MTLPGLNIFKLPPVSQVGSASNTAAASAVSGAPSGNFAQMLANAVDQTNNALQTADSMASSYAAGGPVSLDQLMIAEQQASLSLDLVVQVRDRAVSAYQSIMNMQI